MKFATITLNPSIDRYYDARDGFYSGELNRFDAATEYPGGKGINVSRMLKKLGQDSSCYILSGGTNGEKLKKLLKDEDIEPVCISTRCETRINTKITDGEGSQTEINENGGPVSKDEFQGLLRLLDLSDCDVYFLSGSNPKGLSPAACKTVVELLRLKQKKVICDLSGEALKEAVEARPFLIKPNRQEFEGLLGREIEDRDVVRSASEFFRGTGIEILLTLGKDGSVYSGEAGTFFVSSPEVRNARGFSGAGDTFLSSFSLIREKTGDVEKALDFGCAAAFAKVQCDGTALPELSDIKNALSKITLKKINLL